MPKSNYRKPNVHFNGMFKYHFKGLKVFIRWSFRSLVCYKASLMTLYVVIIAKDLFLRALMEFDSPENLSGL